MSTGEDWVLLKSFADLLHADAMCTWLQQEQIPAKVETRAPGNAGGSQYSVFVTERLVDRARSVVAHLPATDSRAKGWRSPDFPFGLDSLFSVGIGVLLSLACMVLAFVTEKWSLVVMGLGFAAFVPSRYYSPSPLFRPLSRTTLGANVYLGLTQPRWVNACDMVGIVLFGAFLLLHWYGNI